MSYECDNCGKTFANASNLLRHKKVVHAYGNRNLGQQTLMVNGVTVMQHPFTCIVAGCTQSGKTVWVKIPLENSQKTVSPPSQRIIWCYGQWQPSYFDMLRTMPGIEFNQGIPRQYRQHRLLGRISTKFDRIGRHYGSNLVKINVFLIFLPKEAIIEICLSSILSKTYFIRAKK
jgi:hypothetical protein